MMGAVCHTLKKAFSERNIPCVEDGEALTFESSGREHDFSNMWAVLMALLRAEWFTSSAASCVWVDDDGAEEDVLSQAWKARRSRVTADYGERW